MKVAVPVVAMHGKPAGAVMPTSPGLVELAVESPPVVGQSDHGLPGVRSKATSFKRSRRERLDLIPQR